MDQYTNPKHPLYVPGTLNIYAQQYDIEEAYADDIPRSSLKRDPKSQIVLMPQPSDSPNDPLNWSSWRKTWHCILMTFFTAFTAASTNDSGATQDSLNELYGISYQSMNTGAGILFVAIGWGTLLMSPFSNLYGRKISYLICLLFSLFGSIWLALSKNTADAIWCQFFIGISESCAEAHVQLSLSDIFFQHQLSSVLTLYIMATSIGTFLGPLIAGYISQGLDFTWVGWWAAIVSLGALIVFTFTLEETYFDRNLYITPVNQSLVLEGFKEDNTTELCASKDSSSKSVLKVTTSDNDKKIALDDKISSEFLESAVLIDGSQESLKPFWKRIALITPASSLKGFGVLQYFQYLKFSLKMFAFPAVWLSGIYWGWQDVLLTFYLTIEEDNYYEGPWNYSEAAIAIMNVPTLIGAVIGCLYAGVLSDYFVIWLSRRRGGIYECEYRLWFSIAVFLVSPAGLLMFGIASAKNVTDWRIAYVGLGFIGFGWGCSGDIAMSYLMDAYPEMVLEGMVCTSLINNNLACIFTFTSYNWLDAAGIQNTFIGLAVLTAFFTFLALPMYIFGKRARVWSKPLYLKCINERDQ
ncbi:unnamed protein product [Hanseniaspora opuntiae]